jgi:predicted RNA-binding Zn ribbon-like protein
VIIVHVRAESLEDEVRTTVDAAVEISNELTTDDADSSDDQLERLRAVLAAHDFLRAQRATAEELAELVDRCHPLARLVRSFPEAELADAVAAVNHQLQGCAIAPTLSAHDGSALHIHWTAAESPFAHQVTVDLLMALAQTLCDHGTTRFGRCAAEDCARTFYDTTKNRSRRFCADPRCASRTHTAAHRARRAG